MTTINTNDTMNFAAIVAIKNDSDTMLDTLTRAYAEIGYTETVRAIATAVKLKAWDGRISSRNAEWANAIDTENTDGAYMIGIDKLHPAHLDQLADYIRLGKVERPTEKVAEKEPTETEKENENGYTITRNEQYNSIEVKFSVKPSQDIIDGLKALEMRWHGVKKLWYGYADKDAVRAIIDTNNGTTEAEYTEGGETFAGYMGAIGWKGTNSGKYLYGSELSAAIRDHIKHYNIKGVSISCKTYSGGQSVKATFKATQEDFRTVDDILADDTPQRIIYHSGYWYKNADGIDTHRDNAFNESDEDAYIIARDIIQTRIARYFSAYGSDINQFHLDSTCDIFRHSFVEKIKSVKRIIDSYNYDDSNGMVDYFDTNFYSDYTVKAVQV